MVEDFLKIIEAIQKYGTVPAIIAVLVLLALLGFGVFFAKKSTEEAPKKIEGQQIEIPKVTFWDGLTNRRTVKQQRVESDHREEVEIMAFKDMLLYNQIKAFISHIESEDQRKGYGSGEGADIQPARIMIFQYHNTGHYAGGDAMSKMSLRVQTFNTELFFSDVDVTKYRHIMRLDFPYLYERLFHQGHFYLTNQTSIRKEDPKFFSLLTSASLTSAYIEEITDDKGLAIGFVLVGYHEQPENETAAASRTKQLSDYLAATINLNPIQLKKMITGEKGALEKA